jgi:hypothetical protein
MEYRNPFFASSGALLKGAACSLSVALLEHSDQRFALLSTQDSALSTYSVIT